MPFFKIRTLVYLFYLFSSFFLISIPKAFSSAHFGKGTGSILLDDVDCTGQETDIAQCKFKDQRWGSNNCEHSEDVGVRCGKNFWFIFFLLFMSVVNLDICKYHFHLQYVYQSFISILRYDAHFYLFF